MDGEGIVRVRPDAARIRVGVVSEGASPTEVAQENATRMTFVVDAVKKASRRAGAFEWYRRSSNGRCDPHADLCGSGFSIPPKRR